MNIEYLNKLIAAGPSDTLYTILRKSNDGIYFTSYVTSSGVSTPEAVAPKHRLAWELYGDVVQKALQLSDRAIGNVEFIRLQPAMCQVVLTDRAIDVPVIDTPVDGSREGRFTGEIQAAITAVRKDLAVTSLLVIWMDDNVLMTGSLTAKGNLLTYANTYVTFREHRAVLRQLYSSCRAVIAARSKSVYPAISYMRLFDDRIEVSFGDARVTVTAQELQDNRPWRRADNNSVVDNCGRRIAQFALMSQENIDKACEAILNL